MAMLATMLTAKLLEQLSQKRGPEDLLDRTVSNSYHYGTRVRALLCKPFEMAATAITGNQWYQNSNLPCLEVPAVHDTVQRTIERARVILSEEDAALVEQEAWNFLESGEAYALQGRLHVYSLSETSWINTMWEMGIYLSSRKCPINSSTWVGYDREVSVYEKVRQAQDQGIDRLLVRGSCLLNLLMRYRQELRDGTLGQDMVFRFGNEKRSVPIDARKCERVFGTYREPRSQIDAFIDHPESTHIIVMYKGHCFFLDLYKDGVPKSQGVLYESLYKIVHCNDTFDGEFVFTLSSQGREEWAQDRQKLHDLSPANARNMQLVESALFGICLDSSANWQTKSEGAMHGFFTKDNRHFDLPFMLCCKEDGGFYALCSHGPFDATHIAPLIEYVFAREEDALRLANKWGLTDLVAGEYYAEREPENFDLKRAVIELPGDLKSKIASIRCDQQNEGLEIEELVYDGYGKDLMKRAGHPDSVTQMIFQLAYALMEEGTSGVNTYEALSMRHFKGWRTAQGHPLSNESKAFVEAVKTKKVVPDSGSSSPVGHDAAIEALVDGVKALSLDSAKTLYEGSDDRHLFALYCLSKIRGDDVPVHPFLESYIHRMTQYKLSSSQVRQKFGGGGIFLPTEKDGYGLLYQIQEPDVVRVNISSFVKEEGKKVSDFANYLRNAFDLVKPLLEGIEAKS